MFFNFVQVIQEHLRKIKVGYQGMHWHMGTANERWHYIEMTSNVTSSPIGWAHTQNEPWSSQYNTMGPTQKWLPFCRQYFQRNFRKRTVLYFDSTSLKFVPISSFDNKRALVQVIAWHWTGDKPLYRKQWSYSWQIYARPGTIFPF